MAIKSNTQKLMSISEDDKFIGRKVAKTDLALVQNNSKENLMFNTYIVSNGKLTIEGQFNIQPGEKCIIASQNLNGDFQSLDNNISENLDGLKLNAWKITEEKAKLLYGEQEVSNLKIQQINNSGIEIINNLDKKSLQKKATVEMVRVDNNFIEKYGLIKNPEGFIEFEAKNWKGESQSFKVEPSGFIALYGGEEMSPISKNDFFKTYQHVTTNDMEKVTIDNLFIQKNKLISDDKGFFNFKIKNEQGRMQEYLKMSEGSVFHALKGGIYTNIGPKKEDVISIIANSVPQTLLNKNKDIEISLTSPLINKKNQIDIS